MNSVECQSRLYAVSGWFQRLGRSLFKSRSPVVAWLSVGVLFRLLLMPFWGHNDAVWPSWMAKFLLEGHSNVYQYLFDAFGPQTLKPIVWAPYPPLFYYLTAGWLWLIRSLGLLNLQNWVSQWDLVHLHRALLLLKAPYLIFDLGLWLFLSRLAPPTKRVLLTALWALCPITLFTCYVMGQNDLYPTLFLVASLYFARKALTETNQSFLWKAAAATSLGIGAGFKTFPLILLPLFVVFLSGSWAQAVSLSGLGLAPFLTIIAPFLSSRAFLEGSLFNPEGTRLLDLHYSAGVHTGYIFLIGYSAVVLYWAFIGRRRTFARLWIVCFIVLALVYATSWWPFNWLVWSVPLLLLMLAECPSSWPLYVALVAHFFVWTWWWGNGSGVGMLEQYSHSFTHFRPLREFANAVFSYPKLLGLSFSLFVSALGTMLCMLLRQQAKTKTTPGSVGRVFLMSFLPFSLLICNLAASLVLGARGIAYVRQNAGDLSSPPVSEENLVGQTFDSPARGLRAIRLEVKSADRWSDAVVVLHLRESTAASEDVATVPVPVAQLREGRYHTFQFPALDYSQRPYYFFLGCLDAGDEDAVILCQSQEDSYSEGQMFINHVAQATDLSFEAIYAADWDGILYDLAAGVAADRAFFLILAGVISLPLAALAGGIIRRWQRVLVISTMVTVLGGALFLSLSHSPVTFSDRVSLLGYYLPSHSSIPGVALPVKLTFKLQHLVQEDYKVFVHLSDSQGRIVAQHDEYLRHWAGDRYRFTSEWLPGDWTSQGFSIPIGDSVAPGTYQLTAGLYDLQTGNRLRLRGEGRDFLALGTIRVESSIEQWETY